MNILEKTRRVLEQPVCDSCLGRQFGQLLSGYANSERGKTLRMLAAMSIDKEKLDEEDKTLDVSNFSGMIFHNTENAENTLENNRYTTVKKQCSLCNGIFESDKLEKIGKRAFDSAKKFEFRTFVVGSILPAELLDAEESLWERAGIDWAEQLKAEVNREIGKRLELLFEKANIKTEFEPKNPEVVILVDLSKNKINMKINQFFIYGEYQKLVRGIPQTKWPDKKYKTSVEQIIAKPFMIATKGKAHALHGCVIGDTQVILNECTSKIANLENNYNYHEAICYDASANCIKTSKITDCFKLADETFKLQTEETGREIIATAAHPFFSKSGMIPLANIKPGDKVAVNPIKREEFLPSVVTTILTSTNVESNITKWIKSPVKSHISELKKKGLMPLSTNDARSSILARLIGFLFGDGNVKVIRNRDVALEFYGQKIDLETIQNDLKRLGFYSQIHTRKTPGCEVRDYYGKIKSIKPTVGYRLTCYSKALWILLVALGAPVGNKIKTDLVFPTWITYSKLLKQEFLSALIGCEIDKPRLDKRRYNRKSFNTPRFSMNKIEKKLDNGIAFITQIRDMLQEFGIRTLPIRKLPYTTRKDGEKTIKLILDISNEFLNLINLWGNLGFRYCKEKESLAACALQYLTIKKRVVEMRHDLFAKAKKLFAEGLTLSKIHKQLNNDYASKKDIWLWLHKDIKPENIKVPNSFPNFDVWLKTASDGLSDGLIWETVGSIEPTGKQTVYDITVPKHNNFFANGFLVSNSGREDIDARCFAWRPFVLEITEPSKRLFDNRTLAKLAKKISKQVKVRNLRVSNMNEVRNIKEARYDKTYNAIVTCKQKIDKSDLDKLKNLVGDIRQRTPQRVLHRRGDKTRKKHVISIKTKLKDKHTFELTIRGDAGLYIKELINGDSGRTQPSVSGILVKDCVCKALDVIEIHKK